MLVSVVVWTALVFAAIALIGLLVLVALHLVRPESFRLERVAETHASSAIALLEETLANLEQLSFAELQQLGEETIRRTESVQDTIGLVTTAERLENGDIRVVVLLGSRPNGSPLIRDALLAAGGFCASADGERKPLSEEDRRLLATRSDTDFLYRKLPEGSELDLGMVVVHAHRGRVLLDAFLAITVAAVVWVVVRVSMLDGTLMVAVREGGLFVAVVLGLGLLLFNRRQFIAITDEQIIGPGNWGRLVILPRKDARIRRGPGALLTIKGESGEELVLNSRWYAARELDAIVDCFSAEER